MTHRQPHYHTVDKIQIEKQVNSYGIEQMKTRLLINTKDNKNLVKHHHDTLTDKI